MPDSPAAKYVVKFWRPLLDGTRVPFVLLLDENRTMIDMRPEITETKITPTPAPESKVVTIRGRTMETRPDGTRILLHVHDSVLQRQRVLNQFFQGGMTDVAQYPGCLELYQQYAVRKEQLQRDPECSDCSLGALDREFEGKLEKLGVLPAIPE